MPKPKKISIPHNIVNDVLNDNINIYAIKQYLKPINYTRLIILENCKRYIKAEDITHYLIVKKIIIMQKSIITGRLMDPEAIEGVLTIYNYLEKYNFCPKEKRLFKLGWG